MKIYVQWSKSPVDPKWKLYDSSDWKNLPKKPEPPVGILDEKEGLIQQVLVQGMRFSGDHYAIVHDIDFIKIICWNDDIDDYSSEEFEADEIIFYPVGIYNGIINTKIQRIRYLSDKRYNELKDKGLRATGGYDIIKHWSQFVKPDESLIRHGIWTTDEDNQKCNDEPFESWEGWYNP